MSEFEGQVDNQSGAAVAVPKQCSALRKNDMVLIRGQPCKIVEMSVSKTGKHGHAKVHLVGLQVFTGKKYEDICPSTHNMMVPIAKRKEYQVIDVNKDGFLGLMDDAHKLRHDLRLPDGSMGKEIRSKFDNGDELLVSVLSAMNEEQVMSFKLDVVRP